MTQWDCHVYGGTVHVYGGTVHGIAMCTGPCVRFIVSDSQRTFPGDLGIFFDLESTFTSESLRRYGASARKDRAE